MGERRDAYKVLVGKPVGKKPLERPSCRGRIILWWFFRKWDRGAGNGLMWIRRGTGGEHL